jgi:hypothetical protein
VFFFKYFSKSVHCSKKGPGDSGNYATTCTPMVLFIVLFFYFRPLHMFLVFCCLRFFYMAMLDSEIYPPIIILYRVIQISASLHWTYVVLKKIFKWGYYTTVAKNSNVKNVPTKVQLLIYIQSIQARLWDSQQNIMLTHYATVIKIIQSWNFSFFMLKEKYFICN